MCTLCVFNNEAYTELIVLEKEVTVARRRIILGLIVCFSIAVFAGYTRSQTSNSDQTIKPPDAKRLRYMTPEERKRAFEEWAAQQRRLHEERAAKQRMEFEQRAKDRHDGRDERRNQFLKQILEANTRSNRTAMEGHRA